MPKKSPNVRKKLSLKPFVAVAAFAGAALVGLTSSSEPAPPKSPSQQAVEQATRDLVDERMALHLQRLRDL